MKSINDNATGFQYYTYAVMMLFMMVFPPSAMAVDHDTIRIGGDYRIITLSKGDQAKSCRRKCDKDDRCRSWTYIKQRAKTSDGIRFNLSPDVSINLGGGQTSVIPPQCRLKYKLGEKRYNKCCTSGIKRVVNRREGSRRCADYAEKALLQNDKNLSDKCGFRGKFWHDNYGRHYDWCRNTARRRINRKTAMRKAKLRECRNDRPRRNRKCEDYAATALKILEEARRNRCRETDRSWPEEYERVYEWCLSKGNYRRRIAMEKAQDKLSSCLRRVGTDDGYDRDDRGYNNNDRDYNNDNDYDDRRDIDNDMSVRPKAWATGYSLKNGWSTTQHIRMMADVNGDGKADIIGFSDSGVYVSLARRGKFSASKRWVQGYGTGWSISKHPRMMADVNGDGKADIIGFADAGVYVSLARRGKFSAPKRWVQGYGAGWSTSKHPRMMADVNGDGKADIIGFADRGVYVSLARRGRFSVPKRWVQGYGRGWSTSKHPRMMADVNGDGKADIVGFADTGVYVSLARRGRFSVPKRWVRGFGSGWSTSKHPRMMADVNGDGKADIVGFADRGVYVSLARRGSFSAPRLWDRGYGKGWSFSQNLRVMADVNGDGKADIVGIADAGVYVSLAQRRKFSKAKRVIRGFGSKQGWSPNKHPRMMADVNGDGKADIVGFHNHKVFVSKSLR